MQLGPGFRLDAYELISPLGSGGMGEVWLARDAALGRRVALKLLPAALTSDPRRIGRLEQEARAASALNHPNVCTILALGETDEGLHYIAMEYVDGESLRQRLAHERVRIPEALDIGIQVASALSVAHAAGIVHRDIKPENVMLRPDALVKVLDFGLAKLTSGYSTAASESTQTASQTEPGTIVGTAAYMSPEQARGQQVDARTDIWSLGCVLFEMVAGRCPFAARNNSDMLVAILDREPDPLARFDPDVPHELQRIVTKTLRKDRALRYQTTRDLLLDLEALRAELAAQLRSGSEGPFQSPAQPALSATRHSSLLAGRVFAAIRRHRVASAAIAILSSSAVVGLVWFTTFRRPALSPRASVREPVLTRLTANPTELAVTSAQISPDGRYLAYADPSGLRIRLLESGETQSIPNTQGMNVYAWSRDATMVRASACERACVGWDISLLGGARRRSGTTWSEEEIVIAPRMDRVC
jgi:serine/threonine protein kinase